MKGTIPVSLKDLIGEKAYLSYLEGIFMPELKRLSADKKISEIELEKIAKNVDERGIGILNPQVYFRTDITRNTFDEGGWMTEVAHNLTDDVKIRTIIKKVRPTEDVENELKPHKSLIQLLEGTSYENKIPKNVFGIPSKKIIATTFLEGDLLKSRLDETRNEEEKKDILKRVIDDYVDFYKHLNKDQIKSRIKTKYSLINFTNFFTEKYLSGLTKIQNQIKIEDMYAEQIGKNLDRESKHLIQGDLNPTNILINKEIEYIDWANSAKNGFFEFDIGTLLKKSKINSESELELAKYSIESLYGEFSENKLEVYTKNMITQELVATKRYLNNARKEKDFKQKERLEKMALFNYNKALKRLEFSESKGYTTSEFRELIEANRPKEVYRLNEFEELNHLEDPDEFPSQYNLIPKNLSENETFGPEKSIKKIEGKIKYNELLRKLKNIAKVAVPVIFLAGAGFGIYTAFNSGKEALIQEQTLEEQNRENAYLYQRMFENSFKEVSGRILDGEVKALTRVDPFLKEIGDKYNLLGKIKELDPEALNKYEIFKYHYDNAGIIATIMDVNKCFAGIRDMSMKYKSEARGLNIFDPLLVGGIPAGHGVIDPRKNVEEGVKRLIWHLEKYKDLKYALFDFYTPYEKRIDPFNPEKNNEWSWSYSQPVEMETLASLNEKAAELTHSVLNGGPAIASDGGMMNIYIQSLNNTPNYIDMKKYFEMKEIFKFDPLVDTLWTIGSHHTGSDQTLYRTLSGKTYYSLEHYEKKLKEEILKDIEQTDKYIIDKKNHTNGWAFRRTYCDKKS